MKPMHIDIMEATAQTSYSIYIDGATQYEKGKTITGELLHLKYIYLRVIPQ